MRPVTPFLLVFIFRSLHVLLWFLGPVKNCSYISISEFVFKEPFQKKESVF